MMTDWCRLPAGMKCACLDSRPSYERLSPPNTDVTRGLGYELNDYPDNKDSSNEKQEELQFFNDDGSYQLVIVERNLRAADLCQLLAVKNRMPKDPRWTLYEHWIDLGLERPLEDHEDVLRAHHDMESYSKRADKRFVFRKDFRKYDFFHDPQNFFPSDMVVPGAFEDFIEGDYVTSHKYSWPHFGGDSGPSPPYGGGFSPTGPFSPSGTTGGTDGVSLCAGVWVRGPNRRVWAKAFLLLAGTRLYLAQHAEAAARAMRDRRHHTSKCDDGYEDSNKEDSYSLQLFADLSRYQVYSTLNARNHYRAPAEFGLCLRPVADQTPDTNKTVSSSPITIGAREVRAASPPSRGGGGGSPTTITATPPHHNGGGGGFLSSATNNATANRTATGGGGGGGPGGYATLDDDLRCVACDSERQRTGWLTAMRLAKYGKQLRENYRAFKNKGEPMQNKDYATYAVPNDSLRSRVAMDFTGATGRIVEDPCEARAVAAAEGCSWKRRWRPTQRKQPPPRDRLYPVTMGGSPPQQNNVNQQNRTPQHNSLTSQQQFGNNCNDQRQQQQLSRSPASPTQQQHLSTSATSQQQHLSKPWFHIGVTREQAAAILLNRHSQPTGDGIFLVRESRSSPTRGHFVLTYRHSGRACHAHIRPLVDPTRRTPVYSLDGGATKFYDLQQLVEFYQLNSGSLPVRLTQYVSRDDDYAPNGGAVMTAGSY